MQIYIIKLIKKIKINFRFYPIYSTFALKYFPVSGLLNKPIFTPLPFLGARVQTLIGVNDTSLPVVGSLTFTAGSLDDIFLTI